MPSKSMVERTTNGLAAVERRRNSSIAAAGRLQSKIERLVAFSNVESLDDLLDSTSLATGSRDDRAILSAIEALSAKVTQVSERLSAIETRPVSGETILFGGIHAGLPEDGEDFESMQPVRAEDIDIPSFLRDAAAFGPDASTSKAVIRMLADLDRIPVPDESLLVDEVEDKQIIPDDVVETEDQLLARFGIEIEQVKGDYVEVLGVQVPSTGIDKVATVVRDAEASLTSGDTAEVPTKGPYRNARWRRNLWQAIVDRRIGSASSDTAPVVATGETVPEAVVVPNDEASEIASIEETPAVVPQGMRRLQDLDEDASGFFREAKHTRIDPVVPDANGDLPSELPVADLPKPPDLDELREVVGRIMNESFPNGAVLQQIRDAVGQRYNTAGKKPMFWWLLLREGPFVMDSETAVWSPVEA